MLQTITIDPKITPRASVILLHGLGTDGYDLVDLAEQLNLPEQLGVRFVFPHAPVRSILYANNAKMRAWFNVLKIEHHAKEDEAGIRDSENEIIQLITHELSLNIPSEKIILAGFSQGGAMALQAGLRYPQKLGGILVLSAWLP
jgi:phospholipase/carboxylesterase